MKPKNGEISDRKSWINEDRIMKTYKQKIDVAKT